jgi:hypothetical protein
VGSDVPVIELHATRGATFKATGFGSILNIVAAARLAEEMQISGD